MDISVDYKELARKVAEELNIAELKESLSKLKTLDWNPFDDDGDQYVGVWQELQHNWDLIFDVAVQSARVVRRGIEGVASLDDPQKHKVVVQVLDDLVRAPWYIEPFDGVAFDGIVTAAVKYCKLVDWGLSLPEGKPAPIGFKEIG